MILFIIKNLLCDLMISLANVQQPKIHPLNANPGFWKKRRECSKLLKAEKATLKKRLYIKKYMYLDEGTCPLPHQSATTPYIYFVLNMHERFVKMSNPKLSVNTCLYIYMWTGVKSRLWSQSFILYFVIHCTNKTTWYFVNLHLQYELVYI